MKKVCIVTGSRAEYGLLKPVMDEVIKKPTLELQLVVTGMHLSADFGSTYKAIEKDGFKIDEKVEISLTSDTPEGVARSTGLAISGMAEAYKKLDPDIVVLLGDRFEIFGAAAAALISRRVIAHIHGGELTEGAMDDAFRHAITKMSHFHFTSTEEYRKRVIQLGESPERVYNVGAVGLDNIKKMKFLSKDELEKELNFTFGDRNLLVTFHPETLGEMPVKDQIKTLLDGLNSMDEVNCIFTKANADPGGICINEMIDNYVSKNPYKAVSFDSMGQLLYLSTLQFVDAVVGNSSSGIIEVPLFGIPTVNVGSRQKGRIRTPSVINAALNEVAIEKALKKVFSEDFVFECKREVNPYGKGDTSKKIVEILKGIKIDKDLLVKKFHDLG